MRSQNLLYSLLLLFVVVTSYSQNSQYMYYFDKDLNTVDKSKAVFYGTGEREDTLVKLMLYNSKDKHLILIERFTDSSLLVSNGLSASFYFNQVKESEGNYDKGRPDGLWLRWDTSGKVTDSTTYDTGRIVTQTLLYYQPNGKLMEIGISDLVKETRRNIFYDGDSVTEDKTITVSDDDEDKVFTKTEIEAQFPGGNGAWTRYITQQIGKNLDQLSANDNGTCMVRFIVDKEGNISDVQALTLSGTKLAKIAIDAVKKGPKWMPAWQNGRIVKAYRIQPVSFHSD